MTNVMKSGVTVIIHGKQALDKKNIYIVRDKEDFFIMIKNQVNRKVNTNIYASDNTVGKKYKAKFYNRRNR